MLKGQSFYGFEYSPNLALVNVQPVSALLYEINEVGQAAVPAMLVAGAAPLVRESLVAEDDLCLLSMLVELAGDERIRHRAFLHFRVYTSFDGRSTTRYTPPAVRSTPSGPRITMR
jgi:hypothetical protein